MGAVPNPLAAAARIKVCAAKIVFLTDHAVESLFITGDGDTADARCVASILILLDAHPPFPNRNFIFVDRSRKYPMSVPALVSNAMRSFKSFTGS